MDNGPHGPAGPAPHGLIPENPKKDGAAPTEETAPSRGGKGEKTGAAPG